MTSRAVLIETDRTFQEACGAWSAELQRRFGRRACEVRYLPEGNGEPGSELRRLNEARELAPRAWCRARYMPAA
jgi:hypothetical protein